MDERYEKTQFKKHKISLFGYNFIEEWECDFNIFLEANPNINNKLNNSPHLLYNRIEPRNAIYGGRTEVFKIYHKCKENEKIRYLDFCSLYPYVNLYGKYFADHPYNIIYGIDTCNAYLKQHNIHNLYGLIQCKILPPKNLLIPVLPARFNSRLMFVLCRTCAEQLQAVAKCEHINEQRSLVGSWVLDEIKEALNHGYQLIETFELWLYQVEQYDPKTKRGGIFTEYMKMFLKLKTEASGWPDYCTTEQLKQKYLADFTNQEGIILDRNKIKWNPSLRALAKLCANRYNYNKKK